MTARRLRFFFVFASTLVVGWLFACPAMAAGPMCDDRGATAIAPSPTLITPHQTLQVDASQDECVGRFLERVNANDGRAPGVQLEHPDSQAVMPSRARLTAPLTEILPPLEADFGAPRPGVRSRIERPPRA